MIMPINPTVSVILPVYNGGIFLADAISSILNQTYKDFELIVIDDGSTDRTAEVLDHFRKQDDRVRLISRPNRGLVASLNEGIDMARGRFIARMDADDISYPNRLERQLQLLQCDPDLDLVAARAILIDENNQITGAFSFALQHQDICKRPWLGFHFAHPTWMGKTSWFQKYRYALTNSDRCEDQEILTRSYLNSKFCTLDEVVFAYRIRSETDWQQLFKTRCSVLKMQQHYFQSDGPYQFLIIAHIVFLAKICLDYCKKITGCNFQPVTSGVKPADVAIWRNVIVDLAKKKILL